MTFADSHPLDPRFDLAFERYVDVPVDRIWEAWTVPARLMPWFAPAPWVTTACQIELRPGGLFRTVMEGPDGQRFDNTGCFLDVVPGRRLVWTNALAPGFRPARGPVSDGAGFAFSAILEFAPEGDGTRYSARVVHGSEADRATHAAMGFEEGWGKALDQMVAMIRNEA